MVVSLIKVNQLISLHGQGKTINLITINDIEDTKNKENIKYVDEVIRFCPNKYEILCFMFNSRNNFSYDAIIGLLYIRQKRIVFRGITYNVSAFQIYRILNDYKIKKDSNYDSYDEYSNAKSLYRKYKGQINE